MVFQNYALFPHMTVFDNVAFGLRMHKVPTAEIGPRVDESLRLVRLSGLADRFPKQLSGGQQQRVALARAVVLKPKVLLLDEPLSNLDAKLRKDLRAEFHEIHRLSGITTLFVTHDLEEAFSLSDRVAVMNAGRLEQFATPVEIFNRPQSEFVADFVGHSNRLSGVVERDGQGNSVLVCSGLKLHLGRRSFPVGQTAQALVPGHSAMVSARATPSDNNFEAKIERVSFVGPRLIIRLAVGDYVLNFELPATKALSGMVEGDVVHLGLNSEDLVFLPDRGSTF
jgi:ABC-type Fe3+/spermidine/putrescine transport system ATPase subunit